MAQAVPATRGAAFSAFVTDLRSSMLWLTTLGRAPAFCTSAAAAESVTATTGRPSAAIQLPAVREVPRVDTSPAPLPAAARVALWGARDAADGSLAMACVTINPPQRTPPTAASRVPRRTIRRRACLMHGLPKPYGAASTPPGLRS